MRTYRVTYILDVNYEDDEIGSIEDAFEYASHMSKGERGELVEMVKVEKL